MRVRIKICGITRLEDALEAARLGADALGFIFHRPSPRYLEPEKAAAIIENLPAFVTTVGVVVDLACEEVRRIADLSGVDRVQLSGSESPDCCRSLGLKWIKGIRVKGPEDLEALYSYGQGRCFLLDSFVKGAHGGTGKAFNWELAAGAGRFGRIILAGGLTPENVAEAVRIVKPWGVDLSSGVETSPGVKDHGRMAAFVQAVREAEKSC